MVGSKVSLYEEFRRQRVEENKKRMEALNLPMLSQALNKNSSSPKLKPSPMKKVRPRTMEKQLVEVRRSSRLTNKPAPVYREVVFDREPRRIYRRRDLSNRVFASDEAREDAMEKAEKLQSGLEPDYPSFVKSMLQSHVSGGFWLGLPVQFCKRNLPRKDVEVTLVDENDGEYPTVYLAQKTGLSGGWRGFALAHDLADGDALVFQLIRYAVFKVYIVRVNDAEQNGEV